MEFWNALGRFFSTLEPKDWVTAILALVAVLVSVWTASQTWRYHPKPLLMIDHAGMRSTVRREALGETEGPYLWVAVANRGNAPAHDLRFRIRVDNEPDVMLDPKQLDAGRTIRVHHELSSEERIRNEDTGHYDAVFTPSFVPPASVHVQMRWRQSPSLWRTRKKRVRLTAFTD